MSREEHEYTFWTDAFGTDNKGNPIKVQGKEHYKLLMARGGFVPFEEAQKLAEQANNKNKGEGFKVSPELQEFMREIKQCCKADGTIKLSGRMVAKMKELGVNFDSCLPEYLRDGKMEGGVFAG